MGYCDSAEDGKQKSARQKIEDKKLRIENQIKDILGEDYQVSSKSTKIYEVEESAWCATCVLIKYRQT